MPNRIDELFSLNRLRSNWESTGPATNAPESENDPISNDLPPGSNRKTDADARELFARLIKLIDERFPVERATGLRVLMGELQEQISKFSPWNAETEEETDEDIPALYAAMEETLNQIEDVLEALDLAGTKK